MHYPASDLVIDPVLIRKYDVSGPRYTSYPTADRFVEAFGEAELRQWLAQAQHRRHQPAALALRAPAVLRHALLLLRLQQDRDPRPRQIGQVYQVLGAGIGAARRRCWAATARVAELHWGGGTPTFLAREEMRALMHALDAQLRARAAGRVLDRDRPAPRRAGHAWRSSPSLGFNRVSLGVQDFDPAVQKAVHRIQSEEVTRRVVDEARASGFRSVNLDLIYGLPKQTLDSFNRTLDKVIALGPDRIALYSYAHLPQLFKPQRRIAEADLPSAEIEAAAHDARHRPADARRLPLHRHGPFRAAGRRAGASRRRRAGCSATSRATRRSPGDLLGLGVSAIGQHRPDLLPEPARTLERLLRRARRRPAAGGARHRAHADDLVRRAVIQALACHFRVSIESIELAHLIDFRQLFRRRARRPAPRSAHDGLVELDARLDRGDAARAGCWCARSAWCSTATCARRAERASYSRVI